MGIQKESYFSFFYIIYIAHTGQLILYYFNHIYYYTKDVAKTFRINDYMYLFALNERSLSDSITVKNKNL